MISERRTQDRVSMDLLVNKIQDGIPSICLVRDISLRGMRLTRLLGPNLFHSDNVIVEFQLPSAEDILFIEGRRIQEGEDREEFGIHFTSLTPSESVILRDYISQHQAKSRSN